MLAALFWALVLLSIFAAPLPHDSSWRGPFRLLCHNIPSRAFVIGGGAMPICSRCIGLYAGALAGIAAAIATRGRLRIPPAAVMVAALPLIVDGATQALGFRESTNLLRFATGSVAGAFALMAVLHWINIDGEEASNEAQNRA